MGKRSNYDLFGNLDILMLSNLSIISVIYALFFALYYPHIYRRAYLVLLLHKASDIIPLYYVRTFFRFKNPEFKDKKRN